MFNLKIIEPTRKKTAEGDIFVCTMDEKNYYFGRVIKMEVNAGGFPGILLYIYNIFVNDYNNTIPELKKENLLIPPIMTNKQGWTRGYFLTIKNEKLKENDSFHPHCFKSLAFNNYRDEYGNIIEYKNDMICGTFGLSSIKVIDNLMSDALGIPRAPED